MIRLVLALVVAAGAAIAEVPRPSSVDDTLKAMAEALRATGLYEEVVIDRADNSVRYSTAEGEDRRSFPDNLHRTLIQAETDAARQDALDQFVAAMIETHEATKASASDAANVLPVVRPVDFGVGQASAQLVSRPLAGDLRVYYVIDRPNSLSYVTVPILGDMELSVADLPELAARNFANKGWAPEFEGDGIWLLLFDGNYESSFLLQEELWNGLDERLGTVLMIALARDLVLFTDADFDGAEKELQRLADENFDKMSYPLSSEIYVWTENGWALR